MSFTSPVFFLFVLVTVLAFHSSANVNYRKTVLSIASAVLIASYAAAWYQLVPLVLFLVLGYGLVCLAPRFRSGVLLAGGLAVFLLVYVFLKQFFFLSDYHLPFLYVVVGLSYILFRIIHLIVDVSNGEIAVIPGPRAFFLYTCNFLCFVSGPIQTWQDFEKAESTLTKPLDKATVFYAFSRVVTGLVKLAVIAATADYIFENISVQLSLPAVDRLVMFDTKYSVAAASYTAYLYYNFSGYMDIVIGIGCLLGQDVPENFNRPFSARSFLEFWQRWHITLSLWFKAYVFTPVMLLLVRLVPAPAWTPYLGVAAFFATFMLMGIWHGSTLVFVIYGFLMGLGASVNKLAQVVLTSWLGKKRYRMLQDHWFFAQLCRGLTFAYFTMALTCLWNTNLDQFDLLMGRLGFSGVGFALAVLTVGFTLLYAAFETAKGWGAAIVPKVKQLGVLDNFMLASRIILIIFVMGLLTKAPEFVYKAF